QRLLGRDPEAQPRMAPTNHGLVAVVREDRLALAGDGHRQGVAGRGDTITCRAADADDHVWLAHTTPLDKHPDHHSVGLCNALYSAGASLHCFEQPPGVGWATPR